MHLDVDAVERRPLGMTDLAAPPFQLNSLFSASLMCFSEWKLSLPTFLWKEWLYDWRGMLEVCSRVGGNSWREMGGRLQHGTFFMTSMWQRLSLPPLMWTRWMNYYSGSVPFQGGVGGFDPRDSFFVAWVKGSPGVNRLAVWHKYASGGSMTAEEICGRRVSPRVLFYSVSCVITIFFSCSLRQPYSFGATIQHLILQNKKDITKQYMDMMFLNCNKNCQCTDWWLLSCRFVFFFFFFVKQFVINLLLFGCVRYDIKLYFTVAINCEPFHHISVV
jgi:hypothetical protein